MKKEKMEQPSEQELFDALLELAESKYWSMIILYNELRTRYVESSLCSIDPFKEPTNMARTQGIRIGLRDLEAAIKIEKERREKVVEESITKVEKEKE